MILVRYGLIAAVAAVLSFPVFAGGPVVSLTPGGVKAMYLPEETASLTLSVSNAFPQGTVFSCRLKTSDYFGRTVDERTLEVAAAAGAVASRAVTFPQLRQVGFYCTALDWRAGEASGACEASFVNVGAKPAKADRLFGISGFADTLPEEYARLGVGTKAIGIQWRDCERKDGSFDFSRIRAAAEALRAKGVEPIGHVMVARPSSYPRRYLKSGAGPKDDPIVDHAAFAADFERFSAALVEALSDVVGEWAAVAEINLLANMATYMRQRYIDDVRALSRGLRKADPKAKLVALGCSGADGRDKPRYMFLKGLLPDLADFIDGFGIDQYTAGQCYGKGYATINSEQGEIREMMLEATAIARANGKTLVSIDEKGPCIVRATPLSSPLGRKMANIVARDFILLKTVPGFGHWLYFRPFNWDPGSVIDYGMWEKDCPRQAVSAYAATARRLTGATFVREVKVHGDIPCWMFAKNGVFFAALWYNGGKPLPFAVAGVQAEDIEGHPIALASLSLDEAPVYLIAPSQETLERALAAARYDVPDFVAVAERPSVGRLAIAVRNIGGKPIDVSVRGTDASVALKPDETKVLELPASDGKTLTLVSSSGRMADVETDIGLCSVAKVCGWDEVAALPALALDDPMRFAPGYADLQANGLYLGTDDLSATARLGYDDEALYLEFTVKDEAQLNENLPPRVFAADCVQFALDTQNDGRVNLLKGRRGYGDDDYSIVAGLASGERVAWCYTAAEANRSRLYDKRLSDPEIVRDETAKTTRYRLRLPFADLAPLKPVKGKVFGFSFVAFDSDPGDGKYYWIQATPGITGSPDPSKFLKMAFD